MALAAGAVTTVTWLTFAMTVLAASPAPSSAAGGDPRSSGQGPGLVGNPAFAVVVVVAIGVGSVLATLAYLRMTAARRG